MPGTVPRRTGLVSNLQQVAPYVHVEVKCENSIIPQCQAENQKENKKDGCAAKETLGTSPRHFLVDQRTISPAQHRGRVVHMSVIDISQIKSPNFFGRFIFRGKRRELTVNIQRPMTNRIGIPSIMINGVSKSMPVETGLRGICHSRDMVMVITREYRPVAGLCFWRNRPFTLRVVFNYSSFR